MVKQIPESASVVFIRMSRTSYIDQTGLYAIEDAPVQLLNEGIQILLVDVQEQVQNLLERIDIIPDLIPRERVLSDFEVVMRWLHG